MDSAFAKLGRARLHRDQLQAEVKAYRSREPLEWEWQTADHALDPSLAVVKFIVHLKEMLPSEDWGLIVGDILTNLRAALDHTVYGHIDCKGLITGANRSLLYFPVAQHPNEWPSKQTQLAPLIDSAVLAVIEQHQPYQHQPVAEDVLVVLSSLVNHDKHRALRVITHTSEDFDVKQSDLEVVSKSPSKKPMTDGATAATMVVRRPIRRGGQQPPALVPPNFSVVNAYIESIDLPSVGISHGVLSTMDVMVNRVEEVLTQMQAAGC